MMMMMNMNYLHKFSANKDDDMINNTEEEKDGWLRIMGQVLSTPPTPTLWLHVGLSLHSFVTLDFNRAEFSEVI